jgi:hypothetical protein
VRYADDFIIGFCGPKAEADFIMTLLKKFLESIHLSVNDTKSKIFHSGDRGIKYLGMYVRYINTNKVTKKKIEPSIEGSTDQVVDLTMKSVNSMQLRVPVDRLVKRAVDRGYAKFRKDGSVRATSCRKLASLTDAQLVVRYSAIIRGILNYYSCVNRRSDLWAICSLYRKSLALTLADKHKLKTAAKVFRKYGPLLKVQPEKPGGKVTTLYYPETLKTKLDFKTGKACVQAPMLDAILEKLKGSHRGLPKTAEVCEYEGCNVSSGLEAHHPNPQANLARKDLTAFEKSLIAKKRKTIMLCGKHHKRMHGRKLLLKDSDVDNAE